MLGFSRRQPLNKQLNELSFQPLVISSQSSSQAPFSRTQQKKISKTHSSAKNNFIKVNEKKESLSNLPREQRSREGKESWVDYGKIQIFDRNLRKNALAEEQRRLRAQSRKQKNEAISEITTMEKNIKGKTIQLQREQQAQIQQLKRLIQKEKKQKVKNEQVYHEKLKHIEKQRHELVRLERKIQEHGVKHQKEYAQEMAVLHKNQYPTNDRSKCHQDLRKPQQPGPQYEHRQQEAGYQRQEFRQRQLQLLNQQREKCMRNQASFNYNLTTVSLLSRASYKIVSTHVSTLVQLLVDDMLEEQVYMLEEIQLKQKMRQEQQKKKDMIQDYYKALEDFVDEADSIESKVGRYATLQFEDLYLPRHYPKQQQRYSRKDQFEGISELGGIDPDATQEILDRRDRFVRFVGNFDEYKKGHLTMFEKVTEELIEEAISKMALELDRGSNDFVELMFRRQFQ